MAENSGGYIGNKPSDSSVTIARQAYTSTGVTTDFTFRSGYTPGYLDAYLNGVRLIETDDYVATDGTTLSLTTAAQNGDTLELIAYKAFNVSEFTLETELGGNFNVSNDLTVGGNINLEGNLDLQDNDKILLGTGDDLQIYHNGNHSYIDDTGTGRLNIRANTGVSLRNYSDSEQFINCYTNGAVELFHDNSKKLETTTTGINITGTTDTDQLLVSGVSTFSGNLNIGTGATVGFGSTAYFRDNASAFFGDDEDLKIYHDGTNSYVSDVGTGGLKITGGDVYIRNTSDQDMIHASSGSFVKLYHNNSEKLATTATGSIVTGILTATDFSGASGGAADFPNGLTGTTGTFSGNVSAVDGTFSGNVSIAGTLTYEDVTNIDSIGIVTARDGLHVTGGNLGIGTDAPTAESGFTKVLHVYDDSPQVLLERETGSGNVRAGFNAWSGNASLETFTTTPLRIRTSGNTNQLYLNTDGKVGIGTDAPDAKLHVYQSDNTSYSTTTDQRAEAEIRITNPLEDEGTFTSINFYNGGGTGGDISLNAIKSDTDYLSHFTIKQRSGGGSTDWKERFRIHSDGKVGINQSTPTADLEVAGTTGTATTVFINAPTHNSSVVSEAVLKFGYAHSGSPDAVAEIKLVEGSTNSFGGNLTFSVPSNNGSGGSSTSEALRITSGGSVGIGTIIPDSILHIESPAATAGWQVRTDSEGLSNESGFYRDVNDDYECVLRNADGGLGYIKNNGGSSDPNLHFYVGSTEKVRITHDGKVGINTQNPQAALDVAGTITQRVVEYPTIRSSLDLNFAATKTLDRRITFTRDSIGTYTDELGIVKYASNNVPRFDHDPDTGESLGLLIEQSRTNQMINSSDITGDTAQNGTITGNATTAPDGTTTADQYAANSTNNIHRVDMPFTSGQISNSTAYSFSVFVKANGYDKLHIRYGGYNSDNHGLGYDLSDGTTFAGKFDGTGSLGAVTSSSMIAYPNDWYRCSFTFTTASDAASGVAQMFYYISNSESTTNFAGDGSSGMYFWGAQMEVGAFPTSHIPTSGSTVTREADHAFVRDIREYDWFNQTEGTVFFEHTDVPNTGTAYYPAIGFSETNDINSDHAIQYFFDTGQDNAYYLVRDSGVDPATIGSNTGFMTAAKVSFVYKENDFVLARNGSIVGSDTSGALPDDSFGLSLGNNGFTDTQFLNAHIKRFSYYPKRLPNAQLQGLTYQ